MLVAGEVEFIVIRILILARTFARQHRASGDAAAVRAGGRARRVGLRGGLRLRGRLLFLARAISALVFSESVIVGVHFILYLDALFY